MPAGYLKMKKSMSKTYGKKKAAKLAPMTWNKRNKGTGRTVGRGRR